MATAVFLVVGLAVYWSSLENPFHYDDRHSIQYNHHLRSLANTVTFFTDPGTFSTDPSGYMFRPLLLVTYAANYAVGGLDVRGFHVVNLLLHLGCAVAVFALARRLTGRGSAAWAAGGLMLLHPVHAEPVNYISARSDLLATCLYLAALAALLARRPVASALAYAGALLGKSVAITFPLFALVGSRGQGRRRGYLAAVALLSLAYLVVIWADRFVASSASKAPRGLLANAWTEAKSFAYYLWLFAAPVRLTVEHAFAQSTVSSAASWAGTCLLLSLAYWAWRGRRHPVGQGACWFLVVLLPVTLVPLNIMVAERRMYLASPGLVLATAWAWDAWQQRRRHLALVAALLACVLMALLCRQRNWVWGDDVRLWEEAVRRSPGMFRARLNLALAYDARGMTGPALEQLQAGLALDPDLADGWVLLGNIRCDQGDLDAAATAYRRALSVDPGLAGAYQNLANVLLKSGGSLQEAIGLYGQALARDPHRAPARCNLGYAYELSGRLPEALQECQQAVADVDGWEGPADPELGLAWYHLAHAAEGLGRTEQAANAYRQAYALLAPHPQFQAPAQAALEGSRRLQGGTP